MLWLAVVLPTLSLEVFASRPAPFAVIEDAVVVACDDQARARGVTSGLSVGQACALCPSLSWRGRDRQAEAALLEGLASLAYGLSPHVVARPEGVLLRFTDQASPVGDPQRLMAHAEAVLGAAQYVFTIAIAPTAACAWLCARCGLRSLWTARDPWRQGLRSLPISHLPLGTSVQAACQALGLYEIGELLDMPRAGLIRRFGAGLVQVLEDLMGERAPTEPFWTPAPQFRRRLLFAFPVATETALWFALQRIIGEWVTVLQARAACARRVTIMLTYEDRSAGSQVLTLARPEREAPVLMRLVRERLRDLRPPSAIVAVALQSPLERAEMDNLPLWRDGQWYEQGFRGFVDRLHARLGHDAVRFLSLQADHRPERATVERPWSPLCGAGPRPCFMPERPLWLLDPPERLAVVGAAPQCRGVLRFLQGPERLETGWWDGPVVRDYFVAINPHQERLWVFRTPQSEWFLQGYFA